ncbi:PstS family phosphate ABC transporter substrate-binding protein [Mucilaginibacter auburnensis]|uniref:Phosphate transport system substrate-binding protein n=1 Tax=Mucilaginibacter auburnensis TaxID=1457233 RepID=A0A2H9VSE6_9SPHI|nr:substrate-binding domain-containing protein [Mucilaginibacter auburnensis]PJJ83740.1 phosphate transport system substrate-binding protein [Mucilaginibacter auburnensis]
MRFKNFCLLMLGASVAISCNRKGGDKQRETTQIGKITIAADESFAPIVDEEAYIFEHSNDSAKVNIVYGTENRVLRMLLNDSVRLAITSRELTADETKILVDRTLPPQTDRFAIDAVTLIVNNASTDTLITLGEIKKTLSGQSQTDVNVVFDNANSSLARYLKDFAGIKELKGRNIYALKDNKEVIRYVASHTNSIGITGFSWLNDPDEDFADAVSKVKIVAVKDDTKKTGYFKPSQTTLALNQYPLTRNLYVINSTGKMGLGTGFAYFILSDRGQRIILRSGILPDSIPTREISLKKNF